MPLNDAEYFSYGLAAAIAPDETPFQKGERIIREAMKKFAGSAKRYEDSFQWRLGRGDPTDREKEAKNSWRIPGDLARIINAIADQSLRQSLTGVWEKTYLQGIEQRYVDSNLWGEAWDNHFHTTAALYDISDVDGPEFHSRTAEYPGFLTRNFMITNLKVIGPGSDGPRNWVFANFPSAGVRAFTSWPYLRPKEKWEFKSNEQVEVLGSSDTERPDQKTLEKALRVFREVNSGKMPIEEGLREMQDITDVEYSTYAWDQPALVGA